MAATLSYRHAFGFKGDVWNNIHYADENVLVYPVGHNVVKYNVDTKLQEFINGSDTSTAITCLAVSASKRVIAVAEQSESGASVCVYNLRTLYKRKVLSSPEMASTKFVSMAFSSDDSLLYTQGGGPDWSLGCWLWEKAKLIATIKVSPMPDMAIHGCSVNPLNPTKACANGKNVFRFFSVEKDRFVPIPMSASFAEREPLDYTAQAWLAEDRCVLGTRTGELLVFDKEDLMVVLPCPSATPSAVTSLLACSRGFISGTEAGVVRLYEKTEPTGAVYAPTKDFRLPSTGASNDIPARIVSMALSPTEELLAVSLSSCQIMQLNLAQADVKEDTTFVPLGTRAHGPALGDHITPLSRTNACAITGMDVCARKPLVVTCGIDCTIRVWNYVDKTQELVKAFPEEPFSVAFHPSGLHIVVGFSDKLRFMNVLMDDVRTVKELPIKACRDCKFSTGGQMFAATSNNLIQVYSTYTFEVVASLRGHSNKVQSLWWTPNDAAILSAGLGGAVYQWDLLDQKRHGEFMNKVGVSSAVCNRGASVVWAVGQDSTLKEIDMRTSSVLKEVDAKSLLGSVVLSGTQSMLFAGRSQTDVTGSVRSFHFPITGDSFEYPACASSVTRLAMSHDDTHLFVAGSDGSLVVFEVRDKDGRIPHRETATVMPHSAETLVTRADLEERAATIAELRDTVVELHSNNDYAMRMRDIAFQEKMKKLTERYTTELDHNREQYDLLREEKMDLEHEFTERLKATEVSHQSEMQKRESLYQNKIMEEVDRFQELQLETESEKERQRDTQLRMQGAHEKEIQAVREKCELELEDARQRRVEMEDEVEGVRRDWEETNRQMEEDIDLEIEQLKARCEEELALEREATLKYKGDNGIMKKKFAALSKDIEDQREEIKSMLEKETGLLGTIENLKKEIELLRTMISDKDSLIGEKEKKIYELKKRNQELEKFKFVLDYKIKELKRQIEPRENEIADMRKQIKEVDAELEEYHRSNAELDLLIGSLRQQLDEMQKGIVTRRAKIKQQESALAAFHHDLHNVAQNVQHPDLLKTGMEELYKKQVPAVLSAESGDTAIAREYQRQRGHLQRSIASLKKQLATENTARKAENVAVMQENMSLIGEIKELRGMLGKMRAKKTQAKARRNGGGGTADTMVLAATGRSGGGGAPTDALIAAQRQEMGALKHEIARLEGALAGARPASTELPLAV